MDAFKVHARFAAKLSRGMIDFLVEGMRVRDTETVEVCGMDPAAVIAGIRGSVFENLTFLRSKAVVELPFDEWCQFLTRRCTMRIQLYLSDAKVLKATKGPFYLFFNKFGNGSSAKNANKLTKHVLEGHIAFCRYMSLLPQSIKIQLRKARDSEPDLRARIEKSNVELEACHKQMKKFKEEYEVIVKGSTIRYPPTWTKDMPTAYARPNINIDSKAIPYPTGEHNPTRSLGMTGDEFNGFDDPDDNGKTSELVELVRRMETQPGDDFKMWDSMGGMATGEAINIPQLHTDPNLDSSTSYPNMVIKMLDAIMAKFHQPCKDIEKLVRAKLLACKRPKASLVKLQASVDEARKQALELEAKAKQKREAAQKVAAEAAQKDGALPPPVLLGIDERTGIMTDDEVTPIVLDDCDPSDDDKDDVAPAAAAEEEDDTANKKAGRKQTKKDTVKIGEGVYFDTTTPLRTPCEGLDKIWDDRFVTKMLDIVELFEEKGDLCQKFK